MRRAIGLPLLVLPILAGPASAEDAPPGWEFSASVYAYDVPDSQDYWNPGFTADRGRLHLEARYQYEAIDSYSVWAGANFHAGTSWDFNATAMLGGVFGDLEGWAPGYRLSLEHSWFGLASEGEYFFDAHDGDGNYLYSWNEIWGAPNDWFRAGIAIQRTRTYESELSVQRGLFVGFTYKDFDVAGYVFNPGWEDPTWVLALRWSF